MKSSISTKHGGFLTSISKMEIRVEMGWQTPGHTQHYGYAFAIGAWMVFWFSAESWNRSTILFNTITA